jgi:hypothetical protein
MRRWIGTAVLATILLVGPRIESIAATSSLPTVVRASQAFHASIRPTDTSARRHVHRNDHAGYRHYRYGYRPYDPRYYARPSYYEPAPLPFGFSFGFGPWW